jgi:hypothetical protein
MLTYIRKLNLCCRKHRILVLGLSKSGTSALTYKIANTLPRRNTEILFEPSEKVGWGSRNTVAKVLLDDSLWRGAGLNNEPMPGREGVDLEWASRFDKKILIVRDPKDRLISSILYCLYHEPRCRDRLFVESFVKLLRRKEAEPDSVRFMDILAFAMAFPRKTNVLATDPPRLDIDAIDCSPSLTLENRLLAFLREQPGLFVVHYEDLVEGHLDLLEDHLGMKLCGKAQVDPSLRRVERTKTRDNFKNWFTADDLPHLRRMFDDFIGHFGRYNDWRLNASKSILPEHGSRYVLRIVNEARDQLGLEPIHVPEVQGNGKANKQSLESSRAGGGQTGEGRRLGQIAGDQHAVKLSAANRPNNAFPMACPH